MNYYRACLRRKHRALRIKRIFDVVVSATMLVLAAPVLIYLAIAIKKDSKGPVFYRQQRVTKGGRIFRIFKFRTMYVDADKAGGLTRKNDNRITPMGEKLRKRRLDELPQLINILSGDMTFVGTRPESVEYVKQYTDEMKATLLLPAGVTSMASIRFKDEDEWIERYVAEGMTVNDAYVQKILPIKMEYNLEYIERFSLWEDLKILVLTVKDVLFAKAEDTE